MILIYKRRRQLQKKVSIGLVGCGEIGHVHAKSIRRIRQAELKAVADINRERASNFARKYGVKRFYVSIEDMLENEDSLDAVAVATPPQTHAELSIKAMESGKHVLVEKPMCVSYEEAEAMVRAAAKNGVILFPIEQFLFTPAIRRAINLVNSGKLGRLLSINAYASVYPLVKRLRDKGLPNWFFDLPGGIYGEEISHSLYTVLKILNESIERIHVSTTGLSVSRALPFTELRVLLETGNRYTMITITSRDLSKHTLLLLSLNCQKGAVIIVPPLSLTIAYPHTLPRYMQILNVTSSFINNISKNVVNVVFRKLYKNCSWEIAYRLFIKSILENSPPPITGEEAKEWVRITNLIWERAGILK